MKHKKLIIISSCILGSIAFLVILMFTLFRVHNVKLNFKNQTTVFASEDNQNAVINNGGFSYSTPIFAVNKKEIIQNLEKNNSYLKVINIETVFPNTLVVHCAEREMLYCIVNDGIYYYCDEELKLLEEPLSNKLEINGVVYLENVDIINKDANKGDFLNVFNVQEIVKNISIAFAYSNKNVADIKGMFKQIEIGYGEDFYTCLNEAHLIFTTHDNFKIKIGLARCNLIEKLNIMLALVPKCAKYYLTHELILDLNPADITQKPYIRGVPVDVNGDIIE